MPTSSSHPSPDGEGTIRNPANPGHFMVIEPVDGRVRIFAGERLIAATDAALRVLEVGRKAYDPVLYVPARDLAVELQPTARTSHCPLKGDASYYALDGEEIAWSYATFDFARALAGHYAFWPGKVRIEQPEAPGA
jgi:uncharacterized protein (DUF427 family)